MRYYHLRYITVINARIGSYFLKLPKILDIIMMCNNNNTNKNNNSDATDNNNDKYNNNEYIFIRIY